MYCIWNHDVVHNNLIPSICQLYVNKAGNWNKKMEAYKNYHSQDIFETENEKHFLSKIVIRFLIELITSLMKM